MPQNEKGPRFPAAPSVMLSSTLVEIGTAARRAARRRSRGEAKRLGRARDRADFIGRIVIVDDNLLQRSGERVLEIDGADRLFGDLAQRDDRVSCGLWVSPKASDAERNTAALALVGEQGVKALKTSFLLGGSPTDPDCAEEIDRIFTTAAEHDLVVHVHTSPGAASDVDQVGTLVDRYGDDTKIHLVHLGGGMSGHMKLIGGRLFDWIEAGKKVYTDTSWTIGFAPAWLVQEIERRGVGHDRILFATDAPWGDFAGEHARLAAAAGDGELADLFFRRNFEALYGT